MNDNVRDYNDVLSDEILEAQNQIDQLKQQLENLKSKLREANREKNKNKFFEEKNKEKREKDNKLLEETMASNSKLNLENIVLKQQLEEKDKEIEMLNATKNNAIECADLFKVALSVRQKDLAIQELEKVNGILTDTIIEVTQDEFDLNKLCYLEEISAKFGEKIQEQIKELKGV